MSVESERVLDSIYERLLLGCREVAAGVDLRSLAADRVYVRTVPDVLAVEMPCVQIMPANEPEQDGESDFENDGVIYPVAVTILDRRDEQDLEARAQWLGWRKALMRAFRRLTTVPGVTEEECWNLVVVPRLLMEPTAPAWDEVRTGFTVLCHTTEPRTRDEDEEDDE